jgi:ketosteroid isomerase-like protein
MPDVNTLSPIEQEVLELEHQWAEAIQRQDSAEMSRFLADSYFLAVAVQGQPLQLFRRDAWLATLKDYCTHSFHVDDYQVHVYGITAVVFMLYSQNATVRGQDRSAQFAITDIWVRQNAGWRVAERHSSRPESSGAFRAQ